MLGRNVVLVRDLLMKVPISPYQVKEGHFVNGNRRYNFKPKNNLPTHYTPVLRNHDNFSYGGRM